MSREGYLHALTLGRDGTTSVKTGGPMAKAMRRPHFLSVCRPAEASHMMEEGPR